MAATLSDYVSYTGRRKLTIVRIQVRLVLFRLLRIVRCWKPSARALIDHHLHNVLLDEVVRILAVLAVAPVPAWQEVDVVFGDRSLLGRLALSALDGFDDLLDDGLLRLTFGVDGLRELEDLVGVEGAA